MTKLQRIQKNGLIIALTCLLTVCPFSLYATHRLVELGGERYAWEFDIAMILAWAQAVISLYWFWRIRDAKGG